MSILDRLNLLIRSNINDGLGRHGSARQALSEMEMSLRQARRQQAELRRGEKQLIAQIREARDRSEQWEERAMLALRSDDEKLAREALVVKNRAMREATRLRDQLDDHRAHMEDIARALEALEHKLDGTRNRMRARTDEDRRSSSQRPRGSISSDRGDDDWEERLRRRQAARRSQGAAPTREEPSASPAFDTSRHLGEFNRMASKIDGMEAEIEAMRELSDIGGDPRREELERIFSSMEGHRRPAERSPRRKRNEEPPISDDLADLKKKFE